MRSLFPLVFVVCLIVTVSSTRKRIRIVGGNDDVEDAQDVNSMGEFLDTFRLEALLLAVLQRWRSQVDVRHQFLSRLCKAVSSSDYLLEETLKQLAERLSANELIESEFVRSRCVYDYLISQILLGMLPEHYKIEEKKFRGVIDQLFPPDPFNVGVTHISSIDSNVDSSIVSEIHLNYDYEKQTAESHQNGDEHTLLDRVTNVLKKWLIVNSDTNSQMLQTIKMLYNQETIYALKAGVPVADGLTRDNDALSCVAQGTEFEACLSTHLILLRERKPKAFQRGLASNNNISIREEKAREEDSTRKYKKLWLSKIKRSDDIQVISAVEKYLYDEFQSKDYITPSYGTLWHPLAKILGVSFITRDKLPEISLLLAARQCVSEKVKNGESPDTESLVQAANEIFSEMNSLGSQEVSLYASSILGKRRNNNEN